MNSEITLMRSKTKAHLACIIFFLVCAHYTSLILIFAIEPEKFRVEVNLQNEQQSLVKADVSLDFLLELVQETLNSAQIDSKPFTFLENHIMFDADSNGKVFSEKVKISAESIEIKKYAKTEKDFLEKVNKNIYHHYLTNKVLVAEKEFENNREEIYKKRDELNLERSKKEALEKLLASLRGKEKKDIEKKINETSKKINEISKNYNVLDVKSDNLVKNIDDLKKELINQEKTIINAPPDVPIDYLIKNDTSCWYSIEDILEIKVPLFSFKTKGKILNAGKITEEDFSLVYNHQPKLSDSPYVKIFLPKIKTSECHSNFNISHQNLPGFFISANFKNALKGALLTKSDSDVKKSLDASTQNTSAANVFRPLLKDEESKKNNIESMNSYQSLLKDNIRKYLSFELAVPNDSEMPTLEQLQDIHDIYAVPETDRDLYSSFPNAGEPLSIKISAISDFVIDDSCRPSGEKAPPYYLSSNIELSTITGSLSRYGDTRKDIYAQTIVFPNQGIDCDNPVTYEKYCFPDSVDPTAVRIPISQQAASTNKAKQKENCKKFKKQKPSTVKICLKTPPHATAENLKDLNWLRKNTVLDKNDNDNIEIEFNIQSAYLVYNRAIDKFPYDELSFRGLAEVLENFFKKKRHHISYSLIDNMGVILSNKNSFKTMLDNYEFLSGLKKYDKINFSELKKIFSKINASQLVDNKSYALKTNISNLKIPHRKCESLKYDYDYRNDSYYAGIEIHPESFLYKDPNTNGVYEIFFPGPNLDCDNPRFSQTEENKKKCNDLKYYNKFITGCLKLKLPPYSYEQYRNSDWIKKNAYIADGDEGMKFYDIPRDFKLYSVNSKGEFEDLSMGSIDERDEFIAGIVKISSKYISHSQLMSLQQDLTSSAKSSLNSEAIGAYLSQKLTEAANKVISNTIKSDSFEIGILEKSQESTVVNINIKPKNSLIFYLERMKKNNSAAHNVFNGIHNFLDNSCVELYRIVRNPNITKKMCETDDPLNDNDNESKKIALAFSKNPYHLNNVLKKIEKTLYKKKRLNFIEESHLKKINQQIRNIKYIAPCVDSSDVLLNKEIKPFCDKLQKNKSIKNKLTQSIKKLQELGSTIQAVLATEHPSHETSTHLESLRDGMMDLQRLRNSSLQESFHSAHSEFSEDISSDHNSAHEFHSAASILKNALHDGPVVEVNQCVGAKAIVSVDLDKLNAILEKLHKEGYFSLATYSNSLNLTKPNIQLGCKQAPQVKLRDGNFEISCDRVYFESSKFYGLKQILNFFGKNNGFKATIDIKKIFSDAKGDNFFIKSVGPKKNKNFLQKLFSFTLLGDAFVRKALKKINQEKNPDPDTSVTEGNQKNKDLFIKVLKKSIVGVIGKSDDLRNKNIESIQPDATNPEKINILFAP